MSLRPSALPKLALCPCYESDPNPGPAAERGTRMDGVFRARIDAKPAPTDDLAPADLEAVEWAVAALRAMAGGERLIVDEESCRVHVPGFEAPGTADAIVPTKFSHADLKTGAKRNYREQMAAYALGLMEQHFASTWTAHLLFCDSREVVTHTFTHREAREIVDRVVSSYRSESKQPVLCEYCSWCAKAMSCPARMQLATTAISATGFDFAAVLADAERLGKFLTACSVLDDFREKAESVARELLTAGKPVPGWKLSKRSAREFVDHVDVGRHMSALGFGEVLAAYGNLSAKKFRQLWEDKLPSRQFPEDLVRQGKPITALLADKTVPSLPPTTPTTSQ
ncbi:MAG: hypothetical protein RIQ71_2158 [Verrucomicrobiota bacterium]